MTSKEEQKTPETDDCIEWSLEEEIRKNDKLHQEDVDALRKFCSTLPNVDITTVTDNVVVALLHSSEYDIDRAKITCTKYFDIRLSIPEVFTGRDIDTDDLKTALELGYYCLLPRTTPEGYRVIFQAIRDPDTSRFNYVAMSKLQTLVLDASVHEDPTCPGYVFVGDSSGYTMTHMWKTSFSITKKIMKYSQEGSPLKILQMHMLNSSSITYFIMRWIKPLLSKHLYDLFQFYTGDQLEEVYKHVPKECLPKDYGGDLPELQEIHKEKIEWLRKMQPKVG